MAVCDRLVAAGVGMTRRGSHLPELVVLGNDVFIKPHSRVEGILGLAVRSRPRSLIG